MGAYNRLFGVACCASPLLLQDILRTKWGFDGYVVTDCGALWDMFMTHKIVKTAEEASALALKAGTDITCGDEYGSLVQAVKDSMVTEKEIDRSIRRLMTARFKLGMFDPPENVPYAQIPFSQNDTEVHSKLARKVAQESIVLLKNEHNTLPLKKELHSIAVIGPYADNEDVLLGNYHGTPSHPITILQGIRNAVGNSVNVGYCLGVPPLEDTVAMKHENASQINSAVQLCKKSDVAIVVAGISPLLEGEEMPVDLEGFKGGDRTTLELPANQEKLLKAISNTGTPIVLVLTNGSALAINWENENIPAIIDAWYPGQQGGNAVADVLFGEYNPAGRLPVTFYKSVNDLPPFEDYNMEGRTYRYFKSSPLYPFGYGLSYTQFEYKTIAVDKPQYSAEDTIHAAVTIANTGNYDGDEVIQCYLRSVDSKLHQPIKSLKGFTRVYFKKGESITVQIPIAVQSFRYFDETKNDYVVEPGTYELQIGASSSDIRLKTNIKIVE